MEGGGAIFEFYGHSCYEGDIELMGVPPVPPTRENPVGQMIVSSRTLVKEKQQTSCF